MISKFANKNTTPVGQDFAKTTNSKNKIVKPRNVLDL